jgi:signal transduction histidine kinase
MSHELRTPLNAVIGFSEVMKAQPFGPVGAPEYVGYVDDIFQSGHHLLAVINDILDMSKIEAGEMKLTETTIEMQSVMNACVRLIAERARKMQVEVSIEAAPSLPWLCGDERMIKQMLLNLLANAVKFTPEGGRVTVRAEIDPVGCLVLSVSDSGIGIAPENLAKVLQPFQQADDPLQRQGEGTGLGLPLVKAMAELHGALLVLDSTVNVGTTAAIRFPSARITAAPQTQAA